MRIVSFATIHRHVARIQYSICTKTKKNNNNSNEKTSDIVFCLFFARTYTLEIQLND